MADELLDLVNEKDEIIGEVWKNEANQNPKLIHREAAAVVYNDSGQILFQKRSMLKKVGPGLWQVTAAGHVGKEEGPIATAHRELLEEVGFDTDLKYFDKTLDKRPNETHFTYWYIGKFPKKAKITIQEDEVDEVAFLSLRDLTNKYETAEFGKGSLSMAKRLWRKIGTK